jgi:uncharacterized membrane protein
MFSGRAYTPKLFAWVTLYAVFLAISVWLIDGHYVTALALRLVVGVLPLIAAFGILDLVMRQHRKHDELQQKITSEGIMFAFGVTAMVTFTYGFLQRSVGAPDLSYFAVWTILGTSWLVGTYLARLRYS